MSPSPDMVRYDIILSGRGNPLAPPLGMEICRIIRDTVVKAIINLVEKCRDWVGMLVYKDNPRPCTEGHLEVAVKPPGRSHRHRDRVHPIIRPKTTAEKIPQRAFHGRLCLVIPVHTQHQVPEHIPRGIGCFPVHGHPDVVNHARALYPAQNHALSRLYILKARAPLPGRPQRP